jgi:uncharacterized membrane protein YidH (DUF202 family)
MKLSHKLHSRTATPLWALAFGFLLSVIGVSLWCNATAATAAGQTRQSLAVTSILLGVLAAVYGVHELSQRRR